MGYQHVVAGSKTDQRYLYIFGVGRILQIRRRRHKDGFRSPFFRTHMIVIGFHGRIMDDEGVDCIVKLVEDLTSLSTNFQPLTA